MNLRIVKPADSEAPRFIVYLDVIEVEVHSARVQWRTSVDGDWNSFQLADLDTWGVYTEETTPFIRTRRVSIAGDTLMGQQYVPPALDEGAAAHVVSVRDRVDV